MPAARREYHCKRVAHPFPPTLAFIHRYVPWEVACERPAEVLVLDCSHATALTCSHHKGQRNPPGGRSDCSTGLVLDALQASAEGGEAAAAVAPWLGQELLAVNHFDADAVLSAFTFINRDLAAQHDAGQGGVACMLHAACACACACWGRGAGLEPALLVSGSPCAGINSCSAHP